MLVGSAVAAPNAKSLLAKADSFRGHFDGALEYTVDIDCTPVDLGPIKRGFMIQSRLHEMLATTTSPSERSGDRVLIAGGEVWEIRQGAKRLGKLPPSSRVNGLAAVGDILATGFDQAYDGKIIGKQIVDGKSLTEIELTSKSDQTTYKFAKCWLDEAAGLVLRAEYYSPTKQILKSATFEYGHQVLFNGKKSPFVSSTKIVHVDTQGSICSVAIGVPKVVELDPSTFDVKRFAVEP